MELHLTHQNYLSSSDAALLHRQAALPIINLGWLAAGLLILAGLLVYGFPAVPLVAGMACMVVFSGLVFALDWTGKRSAARVLLPLLSGLILAGLFIYSFYWPGPTGLVTSFARLVLLALMGLPVLFSALLIHRRAALLAALLDTLLLVAASLLSGEGLLAAFILPVFWFLLVLAGWLYEGALADAAARLERARTQAASPADPEQACLLAYDQTLAGWSNALSLRNGESEAVARDIAETAVRLAGRLGVAGPDLDRLRRGAVLHDIGKIALPEGVLRKPGPLNDAEWEMIHLHPAYAREILERIPALRDCQEIPYYHHERWDGSGYPCHLQGEAIPIAARVFSVVDVWTALLADQPYRAAWSREAAETYIRQQAGSQFDPRVVEAFLAMLEE